jgi:hypothetical protein
MSNSINESNKSININNKNNLENSLKLNSIEDRKLDSSISHEMTEINLKNKSDRIKVISNNSFEIYLINKELYKLYYILLFLFFAIIIIFILLYLYISYLIVIVYFSLKYFLYNTLLFIILVAIIILIIFMIYRLISIPFFSYIKLTNKIHIYTRKLYNLDIFDVDEIQKFSYRKIKKGCSKNFFHYLKFYIILKNNKKYNIFEFYDKNENFDDADLVNDFLNNYLINIKNKKSNLTSFCN